MSSLPLVAVISSLLWQNVPIQKAGDLHEIVGYDDLKTALSDATRVPLHLPAFVPFIGDVRRPVFSILERSTTESYVIQLAWAADCKGGNWCHLGSIQGSAVPIPIKGRKVTVSLRTGIKGYFVLSHCYTYCTEATLLWSQDGNYYAVGIKAGDEKTLLKMANSAIEFAPHR